MIRGIRFTSNEPNIIIICALIPHKIIHIHNNVFCLHFLLTSFLLILTKYLINLFIFSAFFWGIVFFANPAFQVRYARQFRIVITRHQKDKIVINLLRKQARDKLTFGLEPRRVPSVCEEWWEHCLLCRPHLSHTWQHLLVIPFRKERSNCFSGPHIWTRVESTHP